MYDILFIDDKFEEIKESFSFFQKKHIRCFYSDGVSPLPKNDKERLPFKNLKYISLDLHLENRGITTIKGNKNALSTLATVIKSFINDGESVIIIANTSFPGDFDEKAFFKYLDFQTNPKIEKKAKNSKNSLLHQDSDNIIQQAHQEILRSVVIREAIEVENLILEKIRERFDITCGFNFNPKLTMIKIEKFRFSKKIDLLNQVIDNQSLQVIDNQSLISNLNKLRKKRNDFAHGNNPPEEGLLDFLEQVESLKKGIGILEFTS